MGPSTYNLVKLSIFSVRDVEYSYGVIEFESHEEILGKVLGKDSDRLKRELEEEMNTVFTSFSLATGTLNYKGEVLDLAYMRLEREDGSSFEIEIYEKSARSFSNTSPEDHYEFAARLIKALNPDVSIRGPRMIGLA